MKAPEDDLIEALINRLKSLDLKGKGKGTKEDNALTKYSSKNSNSEHSDGSEISIIVEKFEYEFIPSDSESMQIQTTTITTRIPYRNTKLRNTAQDLPPLT